MEISQIRHSFESLHFINLCHCQFLSLHYFSVANQQMDNLERVHGTSRFHLQSMKHRRFTMHELALYLDGNVALRRSVYSFLYLPPNMNESELMNLFSPFGNLPSVRIYQDMTTMVSKGFGKWVETLCSISSIVLFICYADTKSTQTAIQNIHLIRIGWFNIRLRAHGHSEESEPEPSEKIIEFVVVFS